MKDSKFKLLIAICATLICFCFSACNKDDGGENNGGDDEGGNNVENHECVDLGLPSGTLWATCNVGASSPEDYGDYFAWGETTTKSSYDWSNYKYCNGSSSTLTKYCNDASLGYNGFTDSLTKLQADDDAATANWGSDWRMPTIEEWEELIDNTTVIWTKQNGVDGRRFTGTNGNSVFLPSASSELVGIYGGYWSSLLYSEDPCGAWFLSFSSDDCGMEGGYRKGGLSVRPVRSGSGLGGGETNNYTIIVSANPHEGGSVSGGGTFQGGQSCTLNAIASEDYTFDHWTKDGSPISGDSSITFTVTRNAAYVAYFNYTGGSGYGYVDLGLPSGTLWATCNVGASSPEDYGDYFAWGETTTKSSYDWSNYKYSNGSSLTKYCNNSSYGYNGFTDNLTILQSCDDAATANWGSEWCMPTKTQLEELHNSTMVTWTTLNGVYGRRFTGTNGNSIFLPAAGYRFRMSLCDTGTGGKYGSSSLSMGNPNYAMILSFNSDDCDMYNNDRGSGRSVRPVRSDSGLGGGETDNYMITVSANPDEGGSVSGGGTYEEGQSCTLTATAATGYSFQKWTKNGTQVSTNASYTFTVTENASYVAHFQLQTYTISTLSNPSSGGSTTGSGTYSYGQNCTLTANANNGYHFVNWTKNGAQVSTDAIYTFAVTVSGSYVAHFGQQSYTINVSANPTYGGSVSGGGVHYPGQSCTVHANAYSGYTFTNWTENGSQVSTNANYTFTVTSNRNLVANFTKQSQAPTGAINGVFSVSASQRVYFSQGNLQYQPSTSLWRFAEHQYDFIANANSYIGHYYTSWIDLFGWGTSGWNCGNTYYRPWDSNNSNGSLYGPPGDNNLTDSYANSDWGHYNAISNGGNSSEIWRTLTHEEWWYVFNSRSTSSGILYAKAQVNNVNGVILLPDNWSSSYYTLDNTNSSDASFSSNIVNSSVWMSSLQSHGAVFLPAAGDRNGTFVYGVGFCGYYWSASYYGSFYASGVYFDSGDLYADIHPYRFRGFSVRLVCPVQ